MSAWRRAAARVREWIRAPALDRDIAEELQSHLDLLTDDYVRSGLTRDDARRRAQRDLGGAGGAARARESIRDARGLPLVEQAALDIRRALRSLANTRAFAATVIVTLALGIGLTTAVFSLLDHVVLRPLPYPDADRLVSIWEARTGPPPAGPAATPSLVVGPDDANRLSVAPAAYVDFRAHAAAFSGMAGLVRQSATLTGRGEPETLFGEMVTASYFGVLGAVPARGRLLTDADERADAPAVALIAHAFWQRRLGGDPDVIGSSLTLNGRPHEVVGVLPPEFTPVSAFVIPDPITYWTTSFFPPDLLANYADHRLNVIARLAPGASLDDGRRSLTAVSEDIAARSPATNAEMRAFLRPLRDDLVRRVSTSLTVMTLMVAVILLIACVNVANLFIVRSTSRRQDVAIRYALGATRRRVITEMLAESLLLSVVAAAVSLAVAWWATAALVALAPPTLPRLAEVGIDARVLGVGTLLALATGVAFGVLPAWQARRARPVDALSGGARLVASRWMTRWRNGLLVFEVAMSTVLLIGAGLMIRSLVALNQVDLGFRTAGVLAMNVTLPEQRYPTGDRRHAFFQALEARIAAIPGVVSVGYANRFPMRGMWDSGFSIDGPGGPSPMTVAGFQAVSPGYFRTLDIRLVRGRPLTDADTNSSEPVAVVTDAFSTRILDGQDPIGRRFRRGEAAPWITIVGVVADIRRDGQRGGLDPQVFLPAAQTRLYPVRLADVAVRVDGDADALRAALRAAVTAVDADQPIANVRTLDEVVASGALGQRFQAVLVGMFAALALVLATLGVHGVVSYLVAQRTPEIGVRMALGADAGTVVRWLVGATAWRVVAGVIIGLAAAVLLSRYVASLLFGVTATDVPTYAVAVVATATIALAAAGVAARRATAIDPVRALRAE